MKTLLILVLCSVCAVVARAQGSDPDNPPNWCRNGGFTAAGKEFRLATVVEARASFYSDDGECPQQSDPARCRLKSYVVAGDRVIVSRAYGPWLCAWYQPRRGGETVGWLAAASLNLLPAARPTLAQWVGRWKFGNNLLEISRDGASQFLRVKGEAFWIGQQPGNVHLGSVEGRARPPEDGALVLENDDCRVSLWLLGEYLIAADNSQCGGLNVRFDGVYRQR